jgi:putative effector of murein hydrolase LrgA (UPF0299 family)
MAKWGMARTTLGGRIASVYSLRSVSDRTTARERWAVTAAGLAMLGLLSLIGDLLAALAGVAVPGAIVGLALYLLLMTLSPGFAAWTLPAARLLTRLLGALIVPAAVGLAGFAAYVADFAPQLALVLVVSTLVTGLTTALLYAGLRR